jgi:hypothetical protein
VVLEEQAMARAAETRMSVRNRALALYQKGLRARAHGGASAGPGLELKAHHRWMTLRATMQRGELGHCARRRVRMRVAAENVANANSTSATNPNGEPYPSARCRCWRSATLGDGVRKACEVTRRGR